MDLVGATDWAAFESLISTDAHDTFFQQSIVWKRQRTRLDVYGEDNEAGLYDSITLKCLLNYNYMRTWPITKVTESGETDEQSIQIFFSKKYLRDLGYLNGDDYFIYNSGTDKFIIDGLLMKPMGDSSVSQAEGGALLISVIVVRQPTITGKDR